MVDIKQDIDKIKNEKGKETISTNVQNNCSNESIKKI